MRSDRLFVYFWAMSTTFCLRLDSLIKLIKSVDVNVDCSVSRGANASFSSGHRRKDLEGEKREQISWEAGKVNLLVFLCQCQ